MQGTPWTNPESYRKWAPLTYAAELGKFKTPTLVVCGERDYRVPYTQSLEFFNALQRQGVPSKLVVFPDEGHWVLKPQNAQRSAEHTSELQSRLYLVCRHLLVLKNKLKLS